MRAPLQFVSAPLFLALATGDFAIERRVYCPIVLLGNHMKGTALDTPHIAFVGAGNMASSIIGGLIASGHSAACITAADPFPASLERLREQRPRCRLQR